MHRRRGSSATPEPRSGGNSGPEGGGHRPHHGYDAAHQLRISGQRDADEGPTLAGRVPVEIRAGEDVDLALPQGFPELFPTEVRLELEPGHGDGRRGGVRERQDAPGERLAKDLDVLANVV